MDEDGKDINPHIPQYISDAPWYTEPKGPTLKHQRPQEERQIKYSGITDWYRKGVNKEKVATRYRKGACENCGAMTHKKRDCLERPRRVSKPHAAPCRRSHRLHILTWCGTTVTCRSTP